MSSNRIRPRDPVEPVELAILQRVFSGTCIARKIQRDACEAEEMAALLVELFAHGVRQEHHLAALVR